MAEETEPKIPSWTDEVGWGPANDGPKMDPSDPRLIPGYVEVDLGRFDFTTEAKPAKGWD